MSFCKTFVCLTVFVLAFGTEQHADGQVGGGPKTGEILVVDDGREVRLISEPSGRREDNNGGNPPSGANGLLYNIGDNGTDTPNYMLYGFDLSGHSGVTLSGDATVTISKGTIPNSIQRGSVDDVINVSELAISNFGWDEGTGEISFADTPADDGSVSFLNRVQFSGSGMSEPWEDSQENAVSNLTGAITLIASRPGYDASDPDGTKYEIIVPQAIAQRWLDDGLAGLVFSAVDPDPINGDGMSRFNLFEDVTIAFPTPPSVVLGDVNQDGAVDFLDIAPFITLLSSSVFQAEADVNEDGDVDFLDIGPFITLLSS